MFMILLMIIIAGLMLFVYYYLTLENKIEEKDDIFAKDVDVSDIKFPEIPKEERKK